MILLMQQQLLQQPQLIDEFKKQKQLIFPSLINRDGNTSNVVFLKISPLPLATSITIK